MSVDVARELATPEGARLRSLLAPRTIAVVGASRDPARWSRRVLEYSQRAGFAGGLFGVNPAAGDLGIRGVSTVPSLAAIGEPVDLVVIARPALACPDVVAECASLGVGAALVTAAGFGELGPEGQAAEKRMCAIADESGMRLLGPNTFGIFVSSLGVNLTPREAIPSGNIAVISQSGNIVVALYEQFRAAGTGFSAVVGVGNQANVDFADLLEYFAGDPGTAAIGMYIEGLRSSGGRLREQLAACHTTGKPVVVIKAGASVQGARAAATHTGALAADDSVWQAVLDEVGARRVGSTQELTDALAALVSVTPNRGRAMVIADGGGDSVMMIDALESAGLVVAAPGPQTRAALDALTPPYAPRNDQRNPVTLDTAGGVEDDPLITGRCARAAAADPGVDVVVVAGLVGGYPRMLDGELACIDELIALRDSGTPVIVHSAFADAAPKPVARLRAAGIAVFGTHDRLARALATTVRDTPLDAAARADHESHASPASHSVGTGHAGAAAMLLPVDEAAELLRSHGVRLPPMAVVGDRTQLTAALAVAQYPACLKIADPAVAHKSDVGGVRLRLATAADVEAAAEQMWARFPGSPLLVMPMLATGAEFLVGTGADPVFGPFVLVGRGGVLADFDPDVAIALGPLDEDAARVLLLSLRSAAAFTGARGADPVDLDALVGLVAAMSRLAAARPDLSVEMNPVIAYSDGYAVADLRAS